ncbi:hypothetical protein PENTCL1PPCAC_2921, partial [Pristionchus entomophagus]
VLKYSRLDMRTSFLQPLKDLGMISTSLLNLLLQNDESLGVVVIQPLLLQLLKHHHIDDLSLDGKPSEGTEGEEGGARGNQSRHQLVDVLDSDSPF